MKSVSPAMALCLLPGLPTGLVHSVADPDGDDIDHLRKDLKLSPRSSAMVSRQFPSP